MSRLGAITLDMLPAKMRAEVERQLTTVVSSPAAKRAPAPRMNKTEAAYAQHLADEQAAGRVLWYGFERVTLKLADDCRYTPDFAVRMADGSQEFHEVKGHWRDDARVKIRVAADIFRWDRFRAVTRCKGGWTYEEFRPAT
jgi:hypothetical protein